MKCTAGLKLNIELYNLMVIINVFMLKLGYKFILWVLRVFFFFMIYGWMNSQEAKQTTKNSC